MASDIVINKSANIERCIARIRQEYGGDERHLRENMTRQDSIILNLQRTCEAAIDLAMHLVRTRRLGVPQDSRDAFSLLVEAGLLDSELGERLKKMVGFRNVAVHNYQSLNLDIVQRLVTERLGDFLDLTRTALRLPSSPVPARRSGDP